MEVFTHLADENAALVGFVMTDTVAALGDIPAQAFGVAGQRRLRAYCAVAQVGLSTRRLMDHFRAGQIAGTDIHDDGRRGHRLSRGVAARLP